ncbi:MAG: pilus assembly protein PilM [Patescibacteria group bacterium]
MKISNGMSNFLYRFFPPPKYLTQPFFGFDISDRSLKYFSFSRGKNGLRPDRFNQIQIPEGLIKSGEIKKREEFIFFLKENCRKAGIEYAAVSLPEEKAFSHLMSLPFAEGGNIREMIETQLEEHVPLPVSEIIFDYQIINDGGNAFIAEKTGEKDIRHFDVLVSAYPKKIIEEYRGVLEEAGIVPLAFETESQSIVRAALPKEDRETAMVVDFGKARTNFLIISGGYLRFTSTINVGGGDLDKAISKNLGVSLFEAERLKKEKGSVFNADVENEIYVSILPLISVIKDEVEKNIVFWETHASHLHNQKKGKIEKIFLCGGDANLSGFPEYLAHYLRVKIEPINVWVNAFSFEDYVPEIFFKDSLGYAAAVGLALRILEE